jgi:hypothetical protein
MIADFGLRIADWNEPSASANPQSEIHNPQFLGSDEASFILRRMS